MSDGVQVNSVVRKAVPPDLGNHYSWPHSPDCVYVASRGIEWCDCRSLWPQRATTDEVRLAAEEVCRIADTHTTGEVQRGVHDPALNVAIQHLYKALNLD